MAENIKPDVSVTKYIVFVVLLSICCVFLYKPNLTSSSKSPFLIKEFPNNISGWLAKDVIYDKEVISSLNPDNTIYKTYYKDGSRPITLFMAVYGSLEKADLSHSPVVCFTGQGWDIYKTNKQKIDIQTNDTPSIDVNQLLQKKGNEGMISLHWYQTRNKSFYNRGLQKISLFLNKLFGHPDTNAFVRVTISFSQGEDVEQVSKMLNSFVQKLYPELRSFLN